MDDFTQGYIEAMFWTDAGPDSEELADATINDLAPEALAKIKADCKAWQEANFGALKLACSSGDNDMARAGHDFWLTRNGHGTGFWDRPELTKIKLGAHDRTNLGESLTKRCQHREVSLCRGDDGLVYII